MDPTCCTGVCSLLRCHAMLLPLLLRAVRTALASRHTCCTAGTAPLCMWLLRWKWCAGCFAPHSAALQRPGRLPCSCRLAQQARALCCRCSGRHAAGLRATCRRICRAILVLHAARLCCAGFCSLLLPPAFQPGHCCSLNKHQQFVSKAVYFAHSTKDVTGQWLMGATHAMQPRSDIIIQG
jgi:hypothetical protein